MKIINPEVVLLPQLPGIEGIYKQIELAGRTCYKSEDKITEDSAKAFVDRMIKSKHLAMCEHGTLYFKIPANIDVAGNFLDEVPTWTKCKLVELEKGNWWAVTTNFRIMIEHFAPEYMEDLIKKYLCEPTEYHERRITVRFICDRGVTHEYVRHRIMSYAQESTRYCNYLKEKFGGSVTCITPPWLEEVDNLEFEEDLRVIEQIYFKWLKKGWTAQQARGFLSHFTKTELVMTGFVSDWKHFFSLRVEKLAKDKPHPQANELASPLYDKFIEFGYIK